MLIDNTESRCDEYQTEKFTNCDLCYRESPRDNCTYTTCVSCKEKRHAICENCYNIYHYVNCDVHYISLCKECTIQ